MHRRRRRCRFPFAPAVLIAATALCSMSYAAEPPPAADAPVPAAEAAGRMKLPDGFKVTLFAAEPDVVQPIAFTFDDRGRLWVVECLSYPKWEPDKSAGKDRVLIFEDADGDGRFDKRTVFLDNGQNLSGIAVGFGGVYLCSTPNFVFVPDRDADDKPDGEPEILLDGFSLKVSHNVFNNPTWGPDGWLYGNHGITDTSIVGKPGADSQRTQLNCSVWRYHPTKHLFEVVAHGTTNPFGLDFDPFGQVFITNCVIKHAFHMVPGGRYVRMYGQDFNSHAYALMPSCADHIHWGGGEWTESRGGAGKHSEAGGGHAHAGAMIYLGDNWPDKYRGRLFTCNLHGTRINQDRLDRHGSGYVLKHEPDFLYANDAWFRGLDLDYGPDGGVVMSDWSDTGECHDYDDIHRENGRLFKITYGDAKPVKVNVATEPDGQLVEWQRHKNQWFARHARRVLQERAAAGKLSDAVHPSLRKVLAENGETPVRLNALWALHLTGGLDEKQLLGLTNDRDEHVRAWAVQLALEDKSPSPAVVARLADMAKGDDSTPLVRLYLASALQRLPLEQRWAIAEALVAREDDAADANLPLMYWYGIEPLVQADKTRALGLLVKAKIPVLREYVATRAAAAAN